MRRLASHLTVALLVPLAGGCAPSGDEREHIGYVEAEWVYVSAPRSGWIVSRPVREGQSVKKGDLIVTLDDQSEKSATAAADSQIARAQAEARNIATGARKPEIRALEAEREEARAALEFASVRRDRVSVLAEEGFASRQQKDEVDAEYRRALARFRKAEEEIRIAGLAGRPASRAAAQAGIEAAQAAKSSAEYALEQRSIRARRDGEVSETFLNPGEFASAGTPILALLPADGLKVHFFVTQEELPAYPVGAKVQVHADGLRDLIDGEVSFVASSAEYTPPVIYSRDSREKLVFLVKLDISADSGLRPGLPVDIYGP